MRHETLDANWHDARYEILDASFGSSLASILRVSCLTSHVKTRLIYNISRSN